MRLVTSLRFNCKHRLGLGLLSFLAAFCALPAISAQPQSHPDIIPQTSSPASVSPSTLQLAQRQSFIAIPYLWAAEKTGSKPISLTGYAPDAASREALAGQAGFDAIDITVLADGAPDQFEARARAGLRALKNLAAGRVSFNGLQWSIVGRAENNAAKARAERMLRATSPDGTWQIDISVEKAGSLPAMAPYLWSARKAAEGLIAFKGALPSEQLRLKLMAIAPTGLDETSLASGAPDGFEADSAAALDALKQLAEGEAGFDGRNWYINGIVAGSVDFKDLLKNADTPLSDWVVEIVSADDTPSEPQMPAVEKETASTEGHLSEPAKEQSTVNAETSTPADGPATQTDERSLPDSETLPASDGQIAVNIPTLSEAPRIAQEPPVFEVPTKDAVHTKPADALEDRAEPADVTEEDEVVEPDQEQAAGVTVAPLSPSENAVQSEAQRQPQSGGDVTVAIPERPEAMSIAQEPPVFDPADEEGNQQKEPAIGELNADDAKSTAQQAGPGTQGQPAPPAANIGQAAANPVEPSQRDAKPAQNQPASESVPIEEKPTIAQNRYLFAAVKQPGNEIELSGVVPDEASKTYLAMLAGRVQATGLSLGENAPDNFMAEAQKGLRLLKQLESGVLRHEYGQWTVSGEARTPVLETQLMADLGDEAAFKAALTSIPPTKLCREHIDAFASENSILFAAGSARLADRSSEPLDRLANYLNECPDTQVEIEGHTDADGAEDVNLALSVERAEAVVNALIERGIDFHRLYAIGYGESLPVASNDTTAGKSANRRIGFRILDKNQ